VNLVPLHLDLMGSYNQSQVILIKKFLSRCKSVLEGALSFRIFNKVKLISDIILDRVRP
jgi:hypothetical protein